MPVFFAVLRAFLVGALVLLGASVEAQTILKASDTHPIQHPNVLALQTLGKKLESSSNGKFKLQVVSDGALGSEQEVLEKTQIGSIQLARISLGALTQVLPELNVFYLPFGFRNESHLRAVIDGPIGRELLNKISASSARLIALGFMDGGTRSIYTKKEIKSAADLQGLKIRVMSNPVFFDSMRAMGGNGVGIPHREVYSALQTGILDGIEDNLPAVFTANLPAAGIKFCTQTSHLIVPDIFVMSKVSWDKLNKDEQALLSTLAREAQLEQRSLWDKSVADNANKLKAAGVSFKTVDTKPFVDATAGVRAKYGAPYAELLKRIDATK